MTDDVTRNENTVEQQINHDTIDWQTNTGGLHIVAKRLTGRFRQWKWLAMLSWLPFFLGPYLRWQDHQAILFDLGQRQFSLFSLTLYPQDLWLLTLTLLFFALLLALITSLLGRVFCGFVCFQTVWTDIYTLIEGKCEGKTPHQAQLFNDGAWTINKLSRKILKHAAWLMIAFLTGVSFTAWFMDAYQLWHHIVQLKIPLPALISIMTVMIGTYIFAGFMREQVCFWLCPYARLQSVMVDRDTLLPHYDQLRGEPRAKLNRNNSSSQQGSCVDCHLCVAVCPTGIDIRQGQQQGCITCGLCIDACDSVMDKTGQETGLIRYASHNEIHQASAKSSWMRPRVLLYASIVLIILTGLIRGLATLSPTEFNVLHQRQPLFVQLSDGSIQNHYTLKIMNKTQQVMQIDLQVSGLEGARLKTPTLITALPSKMTTVNVFVLVPEQYLSAAMLPLTFTGHIRDEDMTDLSYQSVFVGPQ